MKLASTLILIFASMVLTAGILLNVNDYPGTGFAIGLGVLGLIVGASLKVVMARQKKNQS